VDDAAQLTCARRDKARAKTDEKKLEPQKEARKKKQEKL